MIIEQYIREVADFPRPGVRFKDLSPLLADPDAYATATESLVAPFRAAAIDIVCAIEARGFVFGAAAALALKCGFVPLRKAGKLPAARIGVDYALEYGHDRLEMHADALQAGQRILLVDDVLATGGTLAAAATLVEKGGAELAGAAVVVEIAVLAGRARWGRPSPLHAVVVYR